MAFIHKHTEGEWRINESGVFPNKYGVNTMTIDFSEIFTDCIDVFGGLEDKDDLELKANAKLIAQAPKLLQFAEMLHDHWNSRKEEPFLLQTLKDTLTAAGVEITH